MNKPCTDEGWRQKLHAIEKEKETMALLLDVQKNVINELHECIAKLGRKHAAAIHLLRQLGVHPDVVEGLSK
jgi:hypothetical protein